MGTKKEWKIGAAFGVQSALGTINTTVRDLSGALGVTNGIVLGHRGSGDAESGITLPNFVRVDDEKPSVAASFTEQFPDLLRIEPQGFAITVPLKGNGVVSTPSAGQALPLAGIDALLRAAGLVGANGTAPAYNYTPRHAGSSGGSTIYLTAKLWVDNISWAFSDLAVDSMEIEMTPGGIALATFNFGVPKFDTTLRVEGVTFPTFT